MYTCTLQNFAR